MSFAWLEYLVLAEALLQASTTLAPEEACCRAAISRAYYAVYGAARLRARDQEGVRLPATAEAHQRVITHYRHGTSPLHRAIGDSLRQLRSARNRADYDDRLDRPRALAQFAVRRARQVMGQLEALAPTPPAPHDVRGSAGTASAPEASGPVDR
jgi:uncharacterized protein (UPF0332 family)